MCEFLAFLLASVALFSAQVVGWGLGLMMFWVVMKVVNSEVNDERYNLLYYCGEEIDLAEENLDAFGYEVLCNKCYASFCGSGRMKPVTEMRKNEQPVLLHGVGHCAGVAGGVVCGVLVLFHK